MNRTTGWEHRLYEVTLRALEIPHAWGEHDCATFAADCVEALTGIDPMGTLRGRYASRTGALRLIAENGHARLSNMVAELFEDISPVLARRGDVIACDGPDGEFLAVVQGTTAVAPSPSGLLHVPIRQADRAFRVGT